MRETLRSRPVGTSRQRRPRPIAASLPEGDSPAGRDLEAELAELESLSLDDVRLRWRNHWGRLAPAHLSRNLLFRLMAHRLQAETFGDLDRDTIRILDRLAGAAASASDRSTPAASDGGVSAATLPVRQAGDLLILKPGTLLSENGRAGSNTSWLSMMGSPGMARPIAACLPSPSRLRARSGAAIDSSACDIRIASAR